jgi:hypothetical protein
MSNSCKDCQQPIDWNQTVREKLNTRRPLNLDGTIHSCNGVGRTFRGKAIAPLNESNPTPAAAKTISPTETPVVVDLNNLNVIKAIVAALSEYVAMKQAGLEK